MKRLITAAIMIAAGFCASAQDAYMTVRDARIASFAEDLAARDYRHLLLYIDVEHLFANLPEDDDAFDLATQAGIDNALLNWVFMFEDQSTAFSSIGEIAAVTEYEDAWDTVFFTVRLKSGRIVYFSVFVDEATLSFSGASG
jgi:hypothetical protein